MVATVTPPTFSRDVITVTVNGKMCVDPTHNEEVRQAILDTGLRVNGFCNPGGNNYGYGWFLLLRSDLDAAIASSTTGSLVGSTGLILQQQFTVNIKQSNGVFVTNVEIKQLLLQDSIAFTPTNTNNDLFLVKLVDHRFSSQKEPRRNDIDPFPPHPRFGSNPGVVGSYEEGFRQYWNQSNIPITYDNLILETSYPSVIYRDVRTQNSQSNWDQLNECLGIMSHRIYKLWDGFAIYRNSYVQTVNSNLVARNQDRLMSITDDVTPDTAFLPGRVRIKFRELEGDYGNFNLSGPLIYEYPYTGTDITVANHAQDIHVYNIHDPLFKNTEAYQTQLQEMADEIASLYYASFPNHQRYDATYFGVIPFAPGPDADRIEFFHDVEDEKYKTKIFSLDVANLKYPLIERNSSTTDKYLIIPPMGSVIPARIGIHPGKELCCIYRIDPITENIEPVIFNGVQYREYVFNTYERKVVYNFHHADRMKSGQLVNDTPAEFDIFGTPADEVTTTTSIDPSTSTTTTFTTPDPNAPNACAGSCVWTWDGSGEEWGLTSDTCTFTTTTSTSTTTTEAPLGLCCDSIGGDLGDCYEDIDESTCTGDPNYGVWTEGTFDCSENPCATTTTSTTTIDLTTTTPCLCPGFVEPECIGECEWHFSEGSGWTNISDPNPCIEECPCPPPTSVPASIGGNATIIMTKCGDAVGTTTTPCVGECEWHLSGGSGWSNIFDPCTDACECAEPGSEIGDGLTTVANTECGSGTTTTSSTTTTTAAPSCECVPPAICGINNGDVTMTQCSIYTSEPGCTTSTTTCDCSMYTTPDPGSTTTTTPNPPSCSGCCWIWLNTLGWVLAEFNCSNTATCLSACLSPTEAGDECDIARTPCIVPGTGGTSDPACTGSCFYVWNPVIDRWIFISESCSEPGFACFCVPPSNNPELSFTPGVDPDDCGTAAICATRSVPCQHATTTTTTGTTPDPCIELCGTSTTADPTSTTTTTMSLTGCCIGDDPCVNVPGGTVGCSNMGGQSVGAPGISCQEFLDETGMIPCGGTTTTPCMNNHCVWKYNDPVWVLEDDFCATGCSCSEPSDPGEENEIAETSCMAGTTTTTIEVGLCCDPDTFGPCLSAIPESVCDSLNGIWSTPPESCDPDPCTTTTTTTTMAVGACCNGLITGPCSIGISETDCTDPLNGGTFMLGETTCDPNPCPAATTQAPGCGSCSHICSNGLWELEHGCDGVDGGMCFCQVIFGECFPNGSIFSSPCG